MNGIQTESTNDAGGGKNVGWLETGKWLDYNVSVSTAGNYTVYYRVATPYEGQQLQIKNGEGIVLSTTTLPQTGGFQSWTTASTTLTLPAGNQTLRIYSANGIWNINWFQFVSAGTASDANIFLSSLPRSSVNEQHIMPAGKESFSIYPNPAQNNCTLLLSNKHLGKISIQISDRSGKIVRAFELEKTQSVSKDNLFINGLPPGTYFIKVQIGNWSESKKLIKL